jgi:hypothetical protein
VTASDFPLQETVTELLTALEVWAGRDDSQAQPAVRVAGGRAVDLIDGLSRNLYALRQELVTQIHRSDNAAMDRAGRLLAEYRGTDDDIPAGGA